MKSTMEALEGNKVKVSVELSEEEFEQDLAKAFKKLAREVKLPGFRPGKVPRKVIEARIGSGYARYEALEAGLPTHYAEAVKELDVDVISPPDIDITGGQEEGIVTFDATVEVRPEIAVEDYGAPELTVPSPDVSDEDLDEAVERFLTGFGELEDVDRVATTGDRVVIDLVVVHEGEEIPGMTTDGYTYEVGQGNVVPELDEKLDGASAGDVLEFTAEHPADDEDEPLDFKVTVGQVQELVSPEPTDEWMQQNSEFENVAELRADYVTRMGETRTMEAITGRRNAAAEFAAGLVSDDDVPEAMIDNEVESRIRDTAMRLGAQGIDFQQFLQMSGQTVQDMQVEFREPGAQSAKLDLALRAIVGQQELWATEDELNEEMEQAAEQLNRPVSDVIQQFTDAGQMSLVRWDIQKSKALDWLIDRSTLVDDEGNQLDASKFEVPEETEVEETAPAADESVEESAGEDTE